MQPVNHPATIQHMQYLPAPHALGKKMLHVSACSAQLSRGQQRPTGCQSHCYLQDHIGNHRTTGLPSMHCCWRHPVFYHARSTCMLVAFRCMHAHSTHFWDARHSLIYPVTVDLLAVMVPTADDCTMRGRPTITHACMRQNQVSTNSS